LSETTKNCRKREGFVENNKAFSEKERFAGKDKAFFGPDLAK
jgi:hypothetical protein